MRSRAIVLLAVVGAFAVPLAVALVPGDPQAFRFAGEDAGTAVVLRPGERLCQRDIDVPVDFAAVVLPHATGAIATEVRGDREAGGVAEVCVRATGAAPARLPAVTGGAVPASSAAIDGRPIDLDVHVDFLRERPASLAVRLPEVAGRVALFKPAWLSEGVVIALGLAILLLVPLLLVGAVRDAGRG